MKLHYYLEYLSVEKNKGVRADLGYNICQARAAAFVHLKAGDQNVVIVPVLEDCDKKDEDNIDILDVDVEVRLDEVPEQTEPAKPN